MTLSWARRASDIIHSSETIIAQTAVIVLESNCKFVPLVYKLGRLKRTVKDMGELMNIVIKYTEFDKTKDADSEEDKAGPSKKNGGKGSQSQQNKRRLDQNASDLVANTNVGYSDGSKGAATTASWKEEAFAQTTLKQLFRGLAHHIVNPDVQPIIPGNSATS